MEPRPAILRKHPLSNPRVPILNRMDFSTISLKEGVMDVSQFIFRFMMKVSECVIMRKYERSLNINDNMQENKCQTLPQT